MEPDKTNKALTPAANKQVKIRFKPGLASEGVKQDNERYATTDTVNAERLVRKGFADYVDESNKEK